MSRTALLLASAVGVALAVSLHSLYTVSIESDAGSDAGSDDELEELLLAGPVERPFSPISAALRTTPWCTDVAPRPTLVEILHHLRAVRIARDGGDANLQEYLDETQALLGAARLEGYIERDLVRVQAFDSLRSLPDRLYAKMRGKQLRENIYIIE
ncbi:Hypothetical Protein FCC1311_060082 [Hondaea fermentalgiana]|uniref:Uncharacterized protein n=1 Tax=Hondaea fermentalgiana TaxID=2315210 RepID=A0A2R5GJ78_9STRA|nr:Hypothetical Protein FCC1311_060082 [Hondaea fermentalgiana]|eukprot:GBG29788.1 Hypothetical Protein FCC1311_060082 [Hondaea fermentalgiana]